MFNNLLRYAVGPWGAGLAVAMLIFVQVGCGGDSVSTSGTDQIGIGMSSLMVTLENKSGFALTDVTVEIEPSGMQQTGYTAVISRIESAEKRNISLGEFRALDGTPFSARIRARAVRVTAEDITGQEYEAVVPWER